MIGDAALIRTHVARFAASEIAPRAAVLEHGDPRPAARELLDGLERLGVLELGVGSADDREVLVAALEVLAGESASIATLLLAHVAGRAVAAAAGKATPGRWAYPLLADLLDEEPQVVGAVVGGELTLVGGVELLVGAPVASRLLIPAQIDGELELLAIPADAPGVVIGAPVATLGLRGCPTADVLLPTVRVGVDARLARGARARAGLRGVEDFLRGPALAICAGIAAASLRNATAYARERFQGGVPIVEHQEVRRLLSHLAAAHGVAASGAERLARAATARPGDAALFADGKERVAHAACDGVQVLGGYGYMEDYPQERLMRDAKQAQVLLGRCEVARQAVEAP